MPYKSKAQAAAMHAKAERGEIAQSVVDEFDAASKGRMKKLSEHVKKHHADHVSTQPRRHSDDG